MSDDVPAVVCRATDPLAFAVLLAGGDRRTLRNVDAVVREAVGNPKRIAELVGCIIGCDDEIVRMRASDALEKVSSVPGLGSASPDDAARPDGVA
ncbi:hypothetical protein [Gordonia sp. (in: high G+C Gram-positive bacteria)]|uniref:hypothetical protein n=1 Tax=Gordonia sp. (in: high G+C Gram-positive bacteria) TaxID=84139 RepID=UPI0016B23B65|nr:hypothetical protein [Gordonia sp. (in: high G+C Gram-positive bacteria)]NLG46357.1 hypothetical protein [Gordonia sp. (in: high G+C Gram-positive bacteria)]